MREEHRHLLEEGGAARKSLLPRSRNAHNDVPEDPPGQCAELAFVHRERKDVGRSVLTAIDFVQVMDAFVVG